MSLASDAPAVRQRKRATKGRSRSYQAEFIDVTGERGYSSVNKRAAGAGMANKRASRKARNVKRHRAACKG